MSNLKLTSAQLEKANKLLDEVRSHIKQLGENDPSLVFAFRRRIYKQLEYDERGKPSIRRKLKKYKHNQQSGLCFICSHEISVHYSELDRIKAEDGYTSENTRLLCHECHIEQQKSSSYGSKSNQ